MDKRKRPKTINPNLALRAYVIGVALGDGNLSNPNGRAVRLRITCDTKYLYLINYICSALKKLLPENKISLIRQKGNYLNISCYSNYWEKLLGWSANKGSKIKQNISVPRWIMRSKSTILACLKGLIETDGSIYKDRGYLMVNFTTVIPSLAADVNKMIETIGFSPHLYQLKTSHKKKYIIRISKNTKQFLQMTNINKT